MEVSMANRRKKVTLQNNQKYQHFMISRILWNDYMSYSLGMTTFKWVKVFKNRSSKIFGRQPWTILENTLTQVRLNQ